jgi:hypothetical protein
MSEHFQKVTMTLNVSRTTVEGLRNVSLKVWEELITQSRYQQACSRSYFKTKVCP